MITETELNEIEARANAATPGPWEAAGWDVRTKITADDQRGYLITSCQPSAFPENGAANTEFLSHARTDVPALVAEVRRLQGVNARQAETRAEKAEKERDNANAICVFMAGRLNALGFCPRHKICLKGTTSHFICVKCICDWFAEAAEGEK